MDILLSIYHSVLLFLNCFWLLHCYLCDWFSPLQTHHVVPISGLCTWANRKSEMMLLMHNNNKNRRCYFLIQIDRYLSLHSITFLPFLLWNDLMSLLKKGTDRESMADAKSTPAYFSDPHFLGIIMQMSKTWARGGIINDIK